MTDRQLLQQALDALETISEFAGGEGDVCEIIAKRARLAIPALRERLAHCDRCGKKLGGEGDIHTCTPDPIGDAQDRLIAELAAQPEQEPVAWVEVKDTNYGPYEFHGKELLPVGKHDLYTTPPAAAQPKQEPYGWVQPNPSFNSGIFNLGSACPSGWVGSAIDVYTTPPAAQHQCKWPTCQSEEYQQALAEQINQELVTGAAQRKPLTDEEMWKLWNAEGNDAMNQQEAITFARAIEAAHGIKEKNNG
jgi:hypothetical protein